MNIAVIGRGNVGGGLARLWQAAGHDVSTLGRSGGDATDADVIVVAVPGDSIGDALSLVKGWDPSSTGSPPRSRTDPRPARY